jgi:hypothetical protein
MASASYWQDLIELWERSGLTQSEFCSQHNLGKSTFSKRISIHREQHKPVNSPQKSVLNLLPVAVIPSIDNTSKGIMFKHATKCHQLYLPSSVSAKWVAEFFQCLD